jgi:hypothetical protein
MTNERQKAHVKENLKEKTASGQAPSRESSMDASGQKDWLERKFQELRQEAGVQPHEQNYFSTPGFISIQSHRPKTSKLGKPVKRSTCSVYTGT